MLFEKVKCSNHQCLIAYLCVNHKEWDLDWEALETMRLLRNGIHYEGRPVSEDVWKSYKIKFDVYTNTLMKILKEKLHESH